MPKDFAAMEDSNCSGNASIHEVIAASRRTFLKGGAAASLMAVLAPLAGCATGRVSGPRIGFKGIPVGMGDALVVPEGYVATPLAQWGEPVGVAGNMPAFKIDGSNSAADQAVQMGMHHDGLEYFPLAGSRRGLIAINHEYTDDGLLHVGGFNNMNAEKVLKSQNAHGLSVFEVALKDGPNGANWQMVRPSKYARRITANTPIAISGPAAGHAMMKTAADPGGRLVLGTLANCGSGKTPWGTYLTGEESWPGYFWGSPTPTAEQRRYGMRSEADWYRWHLFDERFDARKHPNEFHRFGWVVELDPMDPTSTPIKRTALGRLVREGACVAVTADQRAVVYSGDDGRFEYIYKFVSRDRIKPAGGGLTQAQANRELLDHGTLYVARYDASGSGRWLPLVHGQGPLVAANGFADQGEVVIKTRLAADAVGATKMDRPEWLAIDPVGRGVYAALTNNQLRGQAGQPAVDGANPRADNAMGHILGWHEDGDFDAPGFKWHQLVLAGAGTGAGVKPEHQGNVKGDAFACPDTLNFDGRGVLWICTDIGSGALHRGEMASLGNNQVLACDVPTREVRRFFTGPVGCELAGASTTPDGSTIFISVQHPGESPSGRNDPAQPRRYSNWPDFNPNGRPRSAVVAVRRNDGGVVGT